MTEPNGVSSKSLLHFFTTLRFQIQFIENGLYEIHKISPKILAKMTLVWTTANMSPLVIPQLFFYNPNKDLTMVHKLIVECHPKSKSKADPLKLHLL